MARILLVGTATLDMVFGLAHHPHADEEMRAASLRTNRGGNAANSAVVLSRLGHAPEFLGVLADAAEAAVIAHDFDVHGVIYARCPRLPGRPPTSSIYLSAGQRSIVHYRDLPELAVPDVRGLDLSTCDWLHCEGRNVDVLAELLADVRRRYPALPVSLELEKPRPGIERLFGLANLLLCSRGFARHHGHEQPQEFLRWMTAQAPAARLTLAWGEAGAYGLTPDGGEICHAPALPVPTPKDTLGAGDTFNAGVIDALLAGCALPQALTRACALAGRKCMMEGFDL